MKFPNIKTFLRKKKKTKDTKLHTTGNPSHPPPPSSPLPQLLFPLSWSNAERWDIQHCSRLELQDFLCCPQRDDLRRTNSIESLVPSVFIHLLLLLHWVFTRLVSVGHRYYLSCWSLRVVLESFLFMHPIPHTHTHRFYLIFL